MPALAATLFAALLAAAAATAATAPATRLQPIEVRAAHTEVELRGKERHARLSGEVIATQADLTLRAPDVDATLGDGGGIARIVARHGVEVAQAGKVAQAGEATFDNVSRTVTLTGDPRLWDGDNLVEGERIVLHVDEKTVQCYECSVDVDPAKIADMKSKLGDGT